MTYVGALVIFVETEWRVGGTSGAGVENERQGRLGGRAPRGKVWCAGVHRKERVEVGEKEPGGSEKDD